MSKINKFSSSSSLFSLMKTMPFWAAMFFFIVTVQAQKVKSKKEEISITSSFKPSILKTGKIEFYAAPPSKDETPYTFKYLPSHGVNSTTMPGFSIKPLAKIANEEATDSAGFFAKLGYGNLQNPLAQLAYQSTNKSSDFSVWADHSSAKSKIEDQQNDQTSVGISFENMINQSQRIFVFAGYDLSNFKQYGFDHDKFTFPKNDLIQRFNNISAGTTFTQLLGEENRTSISPELLVNHFSTNKSAVEVSGSIKTLIKHQLNPKFSIDFAPQINLVSYKNDNDTSRIYNLIQLPININYINKKFKFEGGVNAASYKNKLNVAPNLNLSYQLGQSDFKLLAQVRNDFSINSYQYLTSYNPFIVAPDSLSRSHKTDYGVGFNYEDGKGLNFKMMAGITNFKELPLYINSGASGKDMKVLIETSLNAITLNANLDYVFSDKLVIKSSAEIFIFQQQEKYTEAYGLIPVKIGFGGEWRPFSPLTFKFNALLWKGSKATNDTKVVILVNDAADINMGVDLKLNKKWAIWLDLNNIANAQYQRWNQYASYGFNLVGGIRYSFLNKTQSKK
jgi:hypothetical protein